MATQLPGRASRPEKDKNCDLWFFPSRLGFPDKLLPQERPPKSNAFAFWSFRKCPRSPHPCKLPLGDFYTVVMWQQREWGHEGHCTVTDGAWPRPVSLLILASLPLAPTTHTANGAALLAQGPTQSQHSTNGPSWSDSSPHPPLSSSPGTRWNRHPGCPREPGRGSPGEEQGQGGGNTVLLGKGRAQPWVNRSRPGLPGWPFTQQVGPPLLQAQALTSKLTRLGPPASAPYLTIGRADKGLNKPSLQRSVRRPGRPILNPREETKE